jgi:hypothetical protein
VPSLRKLPAGVVYFEALCSVAGHLKSSLPPADVENVDRCFFS